MTEMTYQVTLSESAFFQISAAALESYIVKRKGKRKALECYGTLWGHMKSQDCHVLYHVEEATLDATAEASSSAVVPNSHNLRLRKEFMGSFRPHLDFLGDFHTHPYDSVAEAKDCGGWEFSDTDRQDIEARPYWADQGLQIGMVVAIGRLRKNGWAAPDYVGNRDNTFFVTFGRYRLWYTAYVAVAHRDPSELRLHPRERQWPACPGDGDFGGLFLHCPPVFGLFAHRDFRPG